VVKLLRVESSLFSPATMQTVFAKIEALKKVNQEIIARITDKQQQKMVTYPILVSCSSDLHLHAREVTQEKNGSDVIKEWKPKKNLDAIPDHFNFKLDYSCNVFEDITRLNEAMWPICQQYYFFEGSPNALEFMGKLLGNYEVLQVLLGSLEEQMLPQLRNLDVVNQELTKVNSAIDNLLKLKNVSPSLCPNCYVFSSNGAYANTTPDDLQNCKHDSFFGVANSSDCFMEFRFPMKQLVHGMVIGGCVVGGWNHAYLEGVQVQVTEFGEQWQTVHSLSNTSFLNTPNASYMVPIERSVTAVRLWKGSWFATSMVTFL